MPKGDFYVGENEMMGRWKKYFKELMYPNDRRVALISCWGMEMVGGEINEQKDTDK